VADFNCLHRLSQEQGRPTEEAKPQRPASMNEEFRHSITLRNVFGADFCGALKASIRL
jgi:hypothetical protein